MTDKVMDILHEKQRERYKSQDIDVQEDINIGTLTKADTSQIRLLAVVVYDTTTKDHPGWYVARIFDGGKPVNCYILRKSYKEIKDDIMKAFPTLIPFNPGAEDDKVILKIWL